MKKIKTYFVYTFYLFISLELFSRVYLLMIFGCAINLSSGVKHHFYPELNKIRGYSFDSSRVNLLILAGSVLYDSSVSVSINGKQQDISFCSPAQKLNPKDFNVLNLSAPGHNSLDSWNKYRELDNCRFDYVFLYHAINDTRANNASPICFDSLYRHIEFYSDYDIIMSHPEINFTATFFTLHWIIHCIDKKSKFFIPKELFRGLLNGHPEPYLVEGKDIKTKTTFKNNYQKIITLAELRKTKVILSTYAWYLPADYSLSLFKKKALDYDQQVFPAELYGIPQNVCKGIITHNNIIELIHHDHPAILFFDFNAVIPHSRYYFNDICHLNDQGCELLTLSLYKVISADQNKDIFTKSQLIDAKNSNKKGIK